MKVARRVTGSRRKMALVSAAVLAVLLLVASVCLAGVRWTADGVDIRTAAAHDAYDPQITPDGSGGAIITWVDDRALPQDIYAQRVLSNGSIAPGWAASGVGICTASSKNATVPQITPDGSGGAIITWQDNRSGKIDIYAQRVLSNGSIAPGWAVNGVSIRTIASGNEATVPQITPDGSGGAIITWVDDRALQQDIYAQRVLSNGSIAPGWAASGVGICTASSKNATGPRITSDGSGGAIITWQDNRSGKIDIYAQRVLSSGSMATGWAVNGVSIRTIASGNEATVPQITPDGSGGAIITWVDDRALQQDIYAQRVLSSGSIAPGWAASGVGICTASSKNATGPRITPDGSGGAIITWQDNRSSKQDIYAQRVLASGSIAPGWAVNGVGIRTATAHDAAAPQITPDGSGGAIITWYDYRSSKQDIYAQRVLASGSTAQGWPADGVSIRTAAAHNAAAPQITPDGSGGAIITWYDYRSSKWDIYAQRVSDPAPTVTGTIPSSGTEGSIVNVTNLAGTGFRAPDYGSGPVLPIVKLKRTGQSDIMATGVKVVSSTKITCKLPIPAGAAAGKWNVSVTNPDGQSATRANAFTVNSRSSTWYLAEGTTAWGFSTYISIQNPNASALTAKVTYMPTGSATVTQDVSLPALSQTTITNDALLSAMEGAKDFSTKVVSSDKTKPIVVDRTMSWTGPGALSPEGHTSVGVTFPAKTWYLPEGSSKWGFETWLLIQNPNPTAATAEVTYMIEGEAPTTVSHIVPANSRSSFNMETDIGSKDASIKVVSSVPVIPERAMYRNSRREGHDSIGTTSPAPNYYLAEGTTGYGFTTYVLIQNPNSTSTNVTVTYMTSSGAKPQAPFSMEANSRKTIRVNDVEGMASTDFSTQVHGTKSIIAERAMYWGADTPAGEACHDSIGMSAPHTTFYLPDGETSNGRETWTLVQNPNSSAVSVQITYMTPSGDGNVTWSESIGANSRKTFSMADKLPSGRAAIMVKSKTSGKKIMVERAMYWNSRGAGTDTIGGYSD